MKKRSVSEAASFVSVVIPAYNCERFIDEAVESVRRQRYEPIEIIIIDDGSTDGTSLCVKTLGEDIRYVYQVNRGPAAARNRGITMAGGEVIAFLDADDYWPANKLNVQVARMNRDPAIEVVLGRIRCTGELTEADRKIRFEGPDNTMISICLGSGVFRRSVFNKVGLFDESLRHYEDHDWFLRAREEGVSMVILKDITLNYRRNEYSMSRRKDMHDPSMIQILKKSLDRRRRQNKGPVELSPKFFDFDDGKVSRKNISGPWTKR
jgi:glycosyltransferase involved in cell wall biosynthesis